MRHTLSILSLGSLFLARIALADMPAFPPDGLIALWFNAGVADGGQAMVAQPYPKGIRTVARLGSTDLYVADQQNNRIRKIDGATGVITTIAGTGATGFSGDGGLAVLGSLNKPRSLAVDSQGNIFFVDSGNYRVRMIYKDPLDQLYKLRTVAGTGVATVSGDGGLATQAGLGGPTEVDVDAQGRLVITESSALRIREVDTNGIIRTIAGGGTNLLGPGFESLPATSLNLSFPASAIYGPDGIYTAVYGSKNYVLRLDTAGYFHVLAGADGYPGFEASAPDGSLMVARNARLSTPAGLAFGPGGALYVNDYNNYRIRRIRTDGHIETVVGNGSRQHPTLGANALASGLTPVASLAVSAAGDLFFGIVFDAYRVSFFNRIYRVNARDSLVTGYAGAQIPLSTPAWNSVVGAIRGGCSRQRQDGSFDVYFADPTLNVIRRINSRTGTIDRIAGTGVAGMAGDGGLAPQAQLNAPQDVAIDSFGNLIVADYGNARIRKITPGGVISTLAGKIFSFGVDTDQLGHVYATDAYAYRIVRINSVGSVTAVAGGVFGSSPDGVPAVGAAIKESLDVAVHPTNGTFYFADYLNGLVRFVDTNGILHNAAGTNAGGSFQPSSEGLPANQVAIGYPISLSLNEDGSLYIGTTKSSASGMFLLRITPDGNIHRVAGTGTPGITGDGGPALLASILSTTSVISVSAGKLLLGNDDASNNAPNFGNARYRAISVGANAIPTPTPTSPPAITISGTISQFLSARAVPGVQLTLIDANTGNGIATTTSTASGTYAFTQIAPNRTLSVQLSKVGDMRTGVSSLDAAYILQAVVGKRQLSAFQQIAADTSGDGTMSPLDAARILQFAVQKITRFPAALNCQSDWLFVVSTTINLPLSASKTCADNTRALGVVRADTIVDFRAVLLGDVNGNWQ